MCINHVDSTGQKRAEIQHVEKLFTWYTQYIVKNVKGYPQVINSLWISDCL